MGVERYHNKQHIENYDTDYIGMTGENLEVVMHQLDDLLYPEMSGLSRIGAQRARADGSVVTSMFTHEYMRTDVSTMGWSIESVRLSVDHTIYLGKTALKQCYKVRLDGSVQQSILRGVEQVIPPQNRVTSMFYLEQHAGEQTPYRGLMIRPNITNDPDLSEEPMTAYDCHQLYAALDEVRTLALHDASEAKTLTGISYNSD